MKLLDIISTNRVAYRLTASDKEGVLAELVERCFIQDSENLGLKAAQQEIIIDTLKEREALGSTGIVRRCGTGVVEMSARSTPPPARPRADSDAWGTRLPCRSVVAGDDELPSASSHLGLHRSRCR